MTTDHVAAERAVRRAYELGRLRLGVRDALWVLPMVGLSLAVSQSYAITLAAGATLIVSVALLRARGQAYARAILHGLVAGSAPLVLPLVLRASGHCCIGNACWSMCMLGCIVGGGLAGVAVGLAAANEREDRVAFLISATWIAGLSGMLGCVMAGASGIAGMVIAIAASSVPLAFARPQRA